jgi:hypothetical protein
MRSCQSILQRLEDYWMSLRLLAMPLPGQHLIQDRPRDYHGSDSPLLSEAKKTKHGSISANKVLNTSTTASPTSSSKLDKAKSTCTELGFTLATEKFGECVLKMMDK